MTESAEKNDEEEKMNQASEEEQRTKRGREHSHGFCCPLVLCDTLSVYNKFLPFCLSMVQLVSVT